MKKVLVMSSRFPYPVIGGDRLRIYKICKELSKEFSVSLLSFCESKTELDYKVPEDGVFEKIYRVLHPKHKSYINTLGALFSRTPLQVAYYQSEDYSKAFKEIYSDFDLIVCHLVRTTDYAIYQEDVPVVAELTDSISLNYERMGKLSGGVWSLKKIIYRIEKNRLNKYEKKVIRSVCLSSFISHRDVVHLVGDNKPNNIVVSNNGVSLEDYPYMYGEKKLKSAILFIGNMTTFQNLDAACWFAKNVMPMAHKKGLVFKVVGKIDEKGKRELQKYDNVIVTGQVESIAAHVHDALVGVCPMRVGAGVQNKILEYMAFGIPTITSPIGAEGIDGEDNKEFLVARSPEEFYESIVQIINNPAKASKISHQGRKFIEEKHSWSGSLRPLISNINHIIS